MAARCCSWGLPDAENGDGQDGRYPLTKRGAWQTCLFNKAIATVLREARIFIDFSTMVFQLGSIIH
jgi:hypothetical protein